MLDYEDFLQEAEMQLIRELYMYRTMTVSLVKKDLKGRYKGSVLGFLWTFINPLLQLGVYTLVFQVILKNPMPKQCPQP